MFWKFTVRILWKFSYMNKILISMTVRFSTWELSLTFSMANHNTRGKSIFSYFSLESCPYRTKGNLFSHSVMSNSLRPHKLQHARPPCPSPTPRVHPNPCASSRWGHPAISPSVVTFSSCPQSLVASGSMSQLFAKVAKLLEFQLQYQSFQRTPRTDLL